MLARVSLLVIASVFFAAAWTSDLEYQAAGESKVTPVSVTQLHPVRQRWYLPRTGCGFEQAIANSDRAREFRGCFDSSAVKLVDERRPLNTIGQVTARIDADEIPMDTLWIFGDCDIELPRDIRPGMYRAVNNRGEVRNIELDDEKLTYHGIVCPGPQRDLYVVDDADSRWYFVRQSRPVRALEFARLVKKTGTPVRALFEIAGGWVAEQWQQVTTIRDMLTRQARSFGDAATRWAVSPPGSVPAVSHTAELPRPNVYR